MHNIAPMTEDQKSIQDAVAAVCREFDAEYWRKTDETGKWPEEFTKAMADGGWLGIAMPEEVGGSGLGLKEASIMMQTVARSGAGFTGCSSIHLNIFGAKPIENVKLEWIGEIYTTLPAGQFRRLAPPATKK